MRNQIIFSFHPDWSDFASSNLKISRKGAKTQRGIAATIGGDAFCLDFAALRLCVRFG
jgi:hypothetical protein